MVGGLGGWVGGTYVGAVGEVAGVVVGEADAGEEEGHYAGERDGLGEGLFEWVGGWVGGLMVGEKKRDITPERKTASAKACFVLGGWVGEWVERRLKRLTLHSATQLVSYKHNQCNDLPTHPPTLLT